MDTRLEDFKSYQESLYSSLLAATKTSGGLAAEDLSFQSTLDPAFGAALERCNKSILSLAESLLSSAAAGTDLTAPKLRDGDDVDTKWGDVVGVVDYLLEKADTCLDDYTGAVKQKNPVPLPGAKLHDTVRKPFARSQFRNQNIDKPQNRFKRKIDNHDNSPFKPILSSKPHAKVPLEESLRPFIDENLQLQYNHPYKIEIEEHQYPDRVFQIAEPIPYTPFDKTTAVWVDTVEDLNKMVSELKGTTEIAVDLEHHNMRSFVGLTCLMQISTRTQDWIVDTIALRDNLEVLNEVFADPNIIKVLHGAYMDIIWLQRDLGLYVVGLFDTYYAACHLGFQRHGLAYLLKKYIDFDADKQYQLADWRMRPLPQDMLDYARSDTHFLLYCYDKMRNELLERDTKDPLDGPMAKTLSESKETALRLYVKETYDPETGAGQSGWAGFFKKNNFNLDPRQTEVLKAIHVWRDHVARDEDESHHYLMPKHVMLNIARSMPEDAPSILALAGNHPSQPLRMRASELAGKIREAKAKVSDEEVKAFSATRWQAYDTTAQAFTPQALPSPATAADVFANLTDANLKGSVTSFWGSALGSSKWTDSATTKSDVRFNVPLPQLTATIFVTSDSAAKKAPEEPYHEYQKNVKTEKATESVIVVKEVGGGRKRHAEEPSEFISQTETITIDDETETREHKKKKRKERKEKAAAEEEEEKEAKPFQPVDYENAPSILHGVQKAQKDEKKKGRPNKGKPAFNPYATQGDAPKGVRKRKTETTGKSSTFK